MNFTPTPVNDLLQLKLFEVREASVTSFTYLMICRELWDLLKSELRGTMKYINIPSRRTNVCHEVPTWMGLQIVVMNDHGLWDKSFSFARLE